MLKIYPFLFLSFVVHVLFIVPSIVSMTSKTLADSAHLEKLNEKYALRVAQLDALFDAKQRTFERKTEGISKIIFDAIMAQRNAKQLKAWQPCKINFDHVYYNQEPIIFYLAKKDSMNGFLDTILSYGADPMQRHPIYTNQDKAATPLSTAKEAGAVKNEVTLEHYISLHVLPPQ